MAKLSSEGTVAAIPHLPAVGILVSGVQHLE